MPTTCSRLWGTNSTKHIKMHHIHFYFIDSTNVNTFAQYIMLAFTNMHQKVTKTPYRWHQAVVSIRQCMVGIRQWSALGSAWLALGSGQHQAVVGIRQCGHIRQWLTLGSCQHQTAASIRQWSALGSGRHQTVVSIRQWSPLGPVQVV